MNKAEQAISEWRAITNKTVSFNKVAIARGATRSDSFTAIGWVFSDGSRVRITGRGKYHKILPEGGK